MLTLTGKLPGPDLRASTARSWAAVMRSRNLTASPRKNQPKRRVPSAPFAALTMRFKVTNGRNSIENRYVFSPNPASSLISSGNR